MRAFFQVLSEDERAQVHERTLSILAKTGVRVDTARGRQLLKKAGAEVDENTNIVRFPRSLVEESLRSAPKKFMLGARRPGWDLQMNSGNCVLVVDGEAIYVLDLDTAERRSPTFDDWLQATRLIDAQDEIGVYWSMVEGSQGNGSKADMVKYWRTLFGNFSKHVQDTISKPEQAPWLLEVLQVIFGDKETIRARHPLSFVLCPQSPLIIEETFTDAYLALAGWDIPVAVMPMPLMGGTAPGSQISTVVLGNCEVLAMLCLLQAVAPGTPVIYAPALAIMDPRSGGYSGGAIESGLLGAAVTEMGRYYGLPVEATGLGTSRHNPGIQTAYERAMNGLLPMLSWPDILLGPGLLGGSMVLCLEELIIDLEIFRMSVQAQYGVATDEDKWLEDVINYIGPGGHFLLEKSTLAGIRDEEWYISKFGQRTFDKGEIIGGKPALIEEARARVAEILATHRPLPLAEEVERELDHIQKSAQENL
ncbi:MAG: trimethylamine methyltransferase family protein [Chloroflexota bacterium]